MRWWLPLAALLLGGAGEAPPLPPSLPPGVAAFGALAADEAPALLLARLGWLLPGRYEHDGGAGGWRLTTIITPVEVPALGGRLYHVEEYRDGEPARLTRVRLYRMSVEAGGPVVHVLNPRDMVAARDAGAAARLGMADIEPDRPACALRVTGFGARMVARMASRACRVGGQWVDYEMLLDEDMLVTCHARRALADDRLTWLQMPPSPCIRQQRAGGYSSAD